MRQSEIVRKHLIFSSFFFKEYSSDRVIMVFTQTKVKCFRPRFKLDEREVKMKVEL